MADAPDANVERLEAFNDMLSRVTSALTLDTVALQSDLRGFKTLRTQWETLADAEGPGGFTSMLEDLDTILDEDVEASATAATDLGALASEQETGALAEADATSDAAAAAFESLAGESAAGINAAADRVRLGAVALSDQAIYAAAALDRVETAAATAFASLRESAAEIVSALAQEMDDAGKEAREHGEALEPSVAELADALGAFSETITAATEMMDRSHGALSADLATSYENWQAAAQETASSAREILAGRFREQAALLEAHAGGLGSDAGAAALDQALALVQAERDAWTDRIDGCAAFLALLPGTSVALAEAQEIADRAAGVLDVL